MSKFQIVFSTGNAAFDEGYVYEIQHVLDQVSRQVENGSDFGRLFDSNGNRIGFYVLQEG